MSQNLSGKKNSNLTKKKKKINNMVMSIRQISGNEKQMLPEYRKEISWNEKNVFIITIKTYFNLEKLTYIRESIRNFFLLQLCFESSLLTKNVKRNKKKFEMFFIRKKF